MLNIILTCKNPAALDRALTNVAKLVPGAAISVLPRTEAGDQRRRIVVENADDQLISKFTRLDITHEVSISITQ